LTQQDTEIKKLGKYLTSLKPPNHIILLYDDPLDIENLKHEAQAREYFESEARRPAWVETSQETDIAQPLYVRRVEGQLSDMEGLLAEERRIDERGQEDSIICAYKLEKFMELGEEPRMEIISLHDHILFSRFTWGEMTLTEATENAINNALGPHGAEIVHRYIEQARQGHEGKPPSFRGYMAAMSGLLGGGAVPLTRLIYRRLFQTMRSSRECE